VDRQHPLFDQVFAYAWYDRFGGGGEGGGFWEAFEVGAFRQQRHQCQVNAAVGAVPGIDG
ncbi:MAG: hypothetical protein MUO38_11000, partial [Anaerolineales bacterium]|nr:hypothetical protein [Anaerolineales bacterium]